VAYSRVHRIIKGQRLIDGTERRLTGSRFRHLRFEKTVKPQAGS